MDVDWTWRLAGKLAAVLFLSTMAAFGAAKLTLGLGLGADLATLAAIAVWLGNFFLIDHRGK
jgi:hypothetical protein